MKCSICGKETDIIALWARIKIDDDDDDMGIRNFEFLCYECFKEIMENKGGD